MNAQTPADLDGEPSAAPDLSGASPVMAQFFDAKARQPDALVFFRMGDFYELFFDDAVKAAAALGITLTQRGKHAGQDIPMAGVPVHAAEAYLAKLIRAGFKVAVCEQMENPAEARKRGSKAVVRRDLVRVVTPGTLTEDGLLDSRGSNRLAAVAVRAGVAAVASVELSTGEVECMSVGRHGVAAALASLQPSEILVPDRLFADETLSAALKSVGGLVAPMASALAEPAASEARLKRLYGVETLDGFGALSGAEVSALGLLAAHLETTQAGKLPALRSPRRAGEADVMAIDPATRFSLEIEKTQGGARDGSLLAAVDRTVTSGGARLLAARLARPLLEPAAIEARLDAVQWFLERRQARERARRLLKGSGDAARALSRLALGRGGPRDLGALKGALEVGSQLADLVAAEHGLLDGAANQDLPEEIKRAAEALTPDRRPALAEYLQRLQTGLGPDLPALARDGGFVAEGVSPELEQARALRDDSRKVVIALEQRLVAESGVAVRIKHNGVLGYFIEVTAKQAEPLMAPPLSATFIHRQTMANQVRFTTVELADLDARIAQAAERALAIEQEIFEAWREEARGRSTFMAEMVETAAILTQATPRSLVILDEIGRGTATYDGLAIAWACAEALHDTNRCRALFATHYHELARLEGRLAHVGNLSLRAKEWNGDLVFLHEARPGPADRSYGVQVAKLAGVPPSVVARAREVLERLEGQASSPARLDDLPLFAAAAEPAAPVFKGPSEVELALGELDLDGMSPREAMEALYRLKGLAKG